MAIHPHFLGQYSQFHNMVIRDLSFGMNDLRSALEGEEPREGRAYQEQAKNFVGLLEMFIDASQRHHVEPNDLEHLLTQVIEIISNRYEDKPNGSIDKRTCDSDDSRDRRDSPPDHGEIDPVG